MVKLYIWWCCCFAIMLYWLLFNFYGWRQLYIVWSGCSMSCMCDLIAHTVLLYVLFCLIYMYCTLYVLYMLHTVHIVQCWGFIFIICSPLLFTLRYLFTYKCSLSVLTKHHQHSLSYRALHHRGSVTISILDWCHFDFLLNIRSVFNSAITFRTRCQRNRTARERSFRWTRSREARPLSLHQRGSEPADQPWRHLFQLQERSEESKSKAGATESSPTLSYTRSYTVLGPTSFGGHGPHWGFEQRKTVTKQRKLTVLFPN